MVWCGGVGDRMRKRKDSEVGRSGTRTDNASDQKFPKFVIECIQSTIILQLQ